VPGFGDKLRRERESRDVPLADVARRTRIGIQYLEALERGDFDGLPGRRGFGKLYIRLYAELFGFDPEPVISEYDRERRERDTPSDAGAHVEPERPRRVRFVPRARKSPTAESTTQPPTPVAEKPVPDATTSATPAAEPAGPPLDPPDAVTPASMEPVTEPSEPAVPCERDPAPETAPPEPSALTMEQTGPSVTGGSPSWKWRIAGGAVALVVLGIFGIALEMRTSRPVEPPAPELLAATGAMAPSAESRPERDDVKTAEDDAAPRGGSASAPAPQVKPTESPSREPSLSSAPPAGTANRSMDSQPLEVSEFELGTRVVDHRLVDVRREFEEGTVASFLTRVRGGAPGQTIYHAWIREGRLVQRIELQLGGSNWRTHSRKTLWGTGDWAVKAQDRNGRVLARVEFHCKSAGVPGSGR